MQIAVLGGTGNSGSKTVRRIARRGHTAIPISRSGTSIAGAFGRSADMVTGEGLSEALEGVDVVVDCSNTANPFDTRILTIGARNVVLAAKEQGVRRIIDLSIVGCDKSDVAYHRQKHDQEQIYRASGIQTVIVRATQFHDFPVGFFEASAPVGVIPVFLGCRFQLVDVAEVAELLVSEAIEPSGDELIQIGGPKVWVSRDLAKIWQKHTRARGVIVNGPFPPSLLRFFRSGDNLAPQAHLGRVGFEDWLETHR